MAWPGIFQRLFANNGAGPKLRSDLFPLAVPASGAASGTGAPGMCYPDGTTLTMDASGMLVGADIGPLQDELETKMDSSRYDADADLRADAYVVFDLNGTIIKSKGISTVTRTSTGVFSITMNPPASDANWTYLYSDSGVPTTAIAISRLNSKTASSFALATSAYNGDSGNPGLGHVRIFFNQG